ncbi:MAG: hypothetical protein ABI599_06750 [Flavobacteriales bacterium]
MDPLFSCCACAPALLQGKSRLMWQVEIHLTDAIGPKEVIVRSITGGELMHFRWPKGNGSFSFDLSVLAPGEYTVDLQGRAKRQVARLVKE